MRLLRDRQLQQVGGFEFAFEVESEHNGEVGMWPLDDLDVDNEVRLVWIPDRPSSLQHPSGGVLQHLPQGKKWHFFICHHQGSGGDQARIMCTELEKRGFRVWYDNRRSADHRNLEGMKRGVRESEVFLLFLSGRKETGGQPDLNGQYEGPFTRWFCQEEMTTAHEVGLRCIGVMESDERFGKPDFEQEKARSLTGGKGGKPYGKLVVAKEILTTFFFHLTSCSCDFFLPQVLVTFSYLKFL